MSLDLFSSAQEEARRLAVAGRELAADYADRMTPLTDIPWSGQAYAFLLMYTRDHHRFQGEDVRMASEGKIPDPPNLKAWGAVIVAALKNGVIEHSGDYEPTSSKKSHTTPRKVWQVVNVHLQRA